MSDDDFNEEQEQQIEASVDYEEPEEIDGLGNDDENQEDVQSDQNNQKKIYWRTQDFSIRELGYMRTGNELDLRPEYQRNYVFDKQKASRLIESILLDIPIPVFYFAEEPNGKLSVIDGQQRLTSFLNFVDGKFPVGKNETVDFTLSGLRVLIDLNKKTFKELKDDEQKKINKTALHTIIIQKESDNDVKFEIFERLNTGSMKLNEDEIRNSVYRGPYIDLLNELSNNKTFESLIRKPNYKNRMLYRGIILRFLALSSQDIRLYRPSMKKYCNKELNNWRFLSKTKADEYRKRFKKSIDLCQSVFGENSFRRFNPGKSETNPDGSWVATRINMALFDIQMCGFAMYDYSQFHGHYDEIREAMLDLMCNDQEFINAIELKTSGTEQMKVRFKKWLDVLDNLASPPSPRVFPFAIKKQLFDGDPTCKLCNNQIMTIADAEVDHITPYSKEGDTIIDNAQLAHRYCNRKKGGKI